MQAGNPTLTYNCTQILSYIKYFNILTTPKKPAMTLQNTKGADLHPF